MPHWRGWLMATYLSCVVAPWTPTPWHRPGGKLKKSTSEHGNDYQSNNQSMADSSSSPAPDRTMNNTVHSCGRCVIGTSQQPFICRDCVAETSGQTCKRCLMLFDNVVDEISSNIAYIFSHSCPLHLPALHRGPRRPTLQLQAVHPGQPRPGLV